MARQLKEMRESMNLIEQTLLMNGLLSGYRILFQNLLKLRVFLLSLSFKLKNAKKSTSREYSFLSFYFS